MYLQSFKEFKGKLQQNNRDIVVIMAHNAVLPVSGILCKRKLFYDPKTEAFRAAQSGNAVLLSLFLQQMKNSERTSALGTAYITEDVIQGTLQDLLIVATENGNLDCVKVLLVEYGVNVDFQNIKGETPLIVASREGHVDVVSFLVEHGADLNLQCNAAGLTALMTACVYNERDVVTFLVEHGANVNLQSKIGDTALVLFFCGIPMYSHDDYCNVLSSLIENGADVNACTHDNQTPLMMASRNGDVNAVTFLVEHGANMDIQNEDGDTALHYAVTTRGAKDNRYCVVEKLLNLGAAQLYNNDHLTPLLQASNIGDNLMVDYFLKRAEYTKKQRIDALELLGAFFATNFDPPVNYPLDDDPPDDDPPDDDPPYRTPHTARAFHYMKCGMTERFQDPSQPLFKQPMEPIEAYLFRKESQTLEELARIKGDRCAIIMEGLLIRERILGTDSTALLEPIRNVVQGGVHWNSDLAICIGLYRHAIKIAKHCNQPISRDIRSIMLALDLKSVILSQNEQKSTKINKSELELEFQKDFVLELLEEIVLEYEKQKRTRRYESLKYEFSDNSERVEMLDVSIQVVQIITKFQYFKEAKMSHVSGLLQKLCNLNVRDEFGNTLLHKAVYYRFGGGFPCIDTVKLLLNAGINVNAINDEGKTPLHEAVKYTPRPSNIDHVTNILEALLDGGAHHDFVNNEGKTAKELARSDEAHRILSQKKLKLELKCISARAVKKYGLSYLGVVPKILEKYISMH